MKIKILLIGSLFMSSLMLNACDDEVNTVVIDPDDAYLDAQNAIAVSLAYHTYGMVANMTLAGNLMVDRLTCDKIYSHSDTVQGDSRFHYGDYTYYYSEKYQVPCSNTGLVEYFLEANEEFAGQRLYEHDIALKFSISGTNSEADDQVYNGDYRRSGSLYAVNSYKSYHFTFECDLHDVHLSKDTDKIYKGTTDFTLTKNYEGSKLMYTYHGKVEFMNEQEAKVIFDDGGIFTINLNNLSINE
ncbi:hypothetical protein [Olivibacter jilunii]|uniref:hypothetical protein n=1 Tax=Olivibacter jilunii TaxID=985016 RepID=UPI001030A253|nr:hypothetical protein [Olivibacter jilunii]